MKNIGYIYYTEEKNTRFIVGILYYIRQSITITSGRRISIEEEEHFQVQQMNSSFSVTLECS